MRKPMTPSTRTQWLDSSRVGYREGKSHTHPVDSPGGINGELTGKNIEQ